MTTKMKHWFEKAQNQETVWYQSSLAFKEAWLGD